MYGVLLLHVRLNWQYGRSAGTVCRNILGLHGRLETLALRLGAESQKNSGSDLTLRIGQAAEPYAWQVSGCIVDAASVAPHSRDNLGKFSQLRQ